MHSQIHSANSPHGKFRKILVIDDNMFILNLIKNILRSPDALVSTCQSGEEGYELACIQHPDVILLDRRLLDISGDSILKMIKNNPETQDIPVAMISSDDNDRHILQSLSLGAADYIVKPFNAKTVVSKVKRLMTQNTPTPDGFYFV